MTEMKDLDTFQRSESSCFITPQNALLSSLKNRNFEEFANILKKHVGKSVDVNFWYDDPHNKTLLDLACSCKRNAKFVELLLKYGAKVNVVNKVLKKAPIHLAVEYSDLETLQLLVNNRDIDVNQLDRSGNTALHIAASNGKADFVELLLKHPAVEVNKANRKSQTPLHVAAAKNNREIIELLARNVDVDLDGVRDFDDKTCRDLISSRFPSMELSKIRQCQVYESLFALLYNRKHEEFEMRAQLESARRHLNEDNGEYTYLQYACAFGLLPFVQTLLDGRADPNRTGPTNKNTPIMIAAYNGYHKIVRLLAETGEINYDPVNGNTVLHSVLNGVMTCHRNCENSRELGSAGDQNFYICLEYLLNEVSCPALDINLPDPKGNTILHYAFRANEPDMIRLLLDKGAYVGHKNFNGDMPIKFMNAETLEKYLDGSITTNNALLGEENYEIIFKYNLLAPPKQSLPENPKIGYTSESGIVEDEYEIVSETEPLVAMSEVPELRQLLKHPLLTTFLELKWYTIRKYFWVNAIFYVTFWALLTIYVLYVYGPVTSYVAIHNSTHHSVVEAFRRSRHESLLWCINLVLCSILFLREFLQFSISVHRYLRSPENWIEVALIITSYCILLCDVNTAQNRSQLAAVAIFLSWMELVLLIGRHPRVSTYVEMFKVVTWNFLKFIAWYSVLILAFALSFYLLFKDQQSQSTQGQQGNSSDNNDNRLFREPSLAIFKAAIMSTGEYDASNIPFGDEVGTSHIIFVLFIFLVSIVLFNLLNGLAVSDTHAIRTDAELVGIVCRAKLISYIEKMAISDPFPCFNVLDKISCCCCCVPIKRRVETRKKHLGACYNSINLFPNVFPSREVVVLVNQKNRVVLENVTVEKKHLTNCYGARDWSIHQSIIKAAKQVLAARASEEQDIDHRGMTKAITSLQEVYENRLITLENASKRTEHRLNYLEDSSKRTEQKLAEIMKFLKEKL